MGICYSCPKCHQSKFCRPCSCTAEGESCTNIVKTHMPVDVEADEHGVEALDAFQSYDNLDVEKSVSPLRSFNANMPNPYRTPPFMPSVTVVDELDEERLNSSVTPKSTMSADSFALPNMELRAVGGEDPASDGDESSYLSVEEDVSDSPIKIKDEKRFKNKVRRRLVMDDRINFHLIATSSCEVVCNSPLPSLNESPLSRTVSSDHVPKRANPTRACRHSSSPQVNYISKSSLVSAKSPSIHSTPRSTSSKANSPAVKSSPMIHSPIPEEPINHKEECDDEIHAKKLMSSPDSSFGDGKDNNNLDDTTRKRKRKNKTTQLRKRARRH